jgi:hypothetical protein
METTDQVGRKIGGRGRHDHISLHVEAAALSEDRVREGKKLSWRKRWAYRKRSGRSGTDAEPSTTLPLSSSSMVIGTSRGLINVRGTMG